MEKKSLKRNIFNHYLVLFVIITTGFCFFKLYSFNRNAQALVILMTAVFYVIWGIVHHKLMHFLTRAIVIEYTLIALIGSLVMLSLIGY
jgi:hypothetical protein